MHVLVCRSSTGQPDWTCVVVGFTTGYVRFYTEVCSGVSTVSLCVPQLLLFASQIQSKSPLFYIQT